MLFLLFMILGSLAGVAFQTKVVCYYNGGASYRQAPYSLLPLDIDPFLCTHIIYAFATLDKTTATQIEVNDQADEARYIQTTALKSRNAKLKVLLSLGGWIMGSELFTRLVSDAQNIQDFANNAVSYLRQYKFDGLDLNWEYPADRGSPKEDKQRYVELLQVLHNKFKSVSPPLLLTAAVGSTLYRVNISYDVPSLDRYLDFINLMTYDFHGSWESTVGIHNGLYAEDMLSISDTTANWVSEGGSKSKLLIGIPFYGKKYYLVSADRHDVGSDTEGAVDVPYFDICRDVQQKHITYSYHPVGRTPYYVDGREYVQFEDSQSIAIKANYVNNHGYGGMFIWAIDLDDASGACGHKFPLLNMVHITVMKDEQGPIIG